MSVFGRRASLNHVNPALPACLHFCRSPWDITALNEAAIKVTSRYDRFICALILPCTQKEGATSINVETASKNRMCSVREDMKWN